MTEGNALKKEQRDQEKEGKVQAGKEERTLARSGVDDDV